MSVTIDQKAQVVRDYQRAEGDTGSLELAKSKVGLRVNICNRSNKL